jgi:hypothetical protein
LLNALAINKGSKRAYFNSCPDTVIGTWVGGGLYYAATKQFNIGLDLRYSKGEVTLFDEDLEAGGFHTGISAGYHW